MFERDVLLFSLLNSSLYLIDLDFNQFVCLSKPGATSRNRRDFFVENGDSLPDFYYSSVFDLDNRSKISDFFFNDLSFLFESLQSGFQLTYF